MAHYELTEQSLNLLYELADLQHPHLKGDNHTRKMIDKVYNNENLSAVDAFCCGQYYERFLDQYTKLGLAQDARNFLGAILAFKWLVK